MLPETEEMLGQGSRVENQLEKVVKCSMCRADVSGMVQLASVVMTRLTVDSRAGLLSGDINDI